MSAEPPYRCPDGCPKLCVTGPGVDSFRCPGPAEWHAKCQLWGFLVCSVLWLACLLSRQMHHVRWPQKELALHILRCGHVTGPHWPIAPTSHAVKSSWQWTHEISRIKKAKPCKTYPLHAGFCQVKAKTACDLAKKKINEVACTRS